MLYNTKGEVPEEEYLVPIGKADLKREGSDCSIITSGKMVLVAMNAADQLAKDGITVDVVDLRTVRPMDVEAIRTSVRKTNRAVVLEEGWEVAGIGAQVVDYIQRDCFDELDAPVIRVHQADVPMPYAKALEQVGQAGRGEDDRGGEEGDVLWTRGVRCEVGGVRERRMRLRGSALLIKQDRSWRRRSSWRRSAPRWRRGAS